jgi:hypothetical protein
MRLGRVLLALLLLPGLAPPALHAQTAQSKAALDALAAPLFHKLAAMKGIADPGQPPPVEIRTREQTRRYIERELARRYSPARVEAERRAMVAWGLIRPDFDLKGFFLDLMEEQLAAYYDPVNKVMAVGDWLSIEQQQAALMHELVHALQDREIPLDAFLQPDPGRGDQLLARQALIEGEAVALTFELLLQAQGRDLTTLPDLDLLRATIAAGTAGPTVSKAPKFIRALLLFPYLEGLHFAYEFRKRQPWSALSGLYRDPPRSTTQILYPAKRLDRREDPLPIALPDLSALLSPDKLVLEDELGEFALAAVAGMYVGEAEGRRAAFGWRGDRYRIWEDGNRYVLAYLVAMQDERMANFLALQLTKVLEGRYPALARKGVPGKAGAIVIWQEAGRRFAVEKRGAEVLLLEAVPSGIADRVREAIWQARGHPKP